MSQRAVLLWRVALIVLSGFALVAVAVFASQRPSRFGDLRIRNQSEYNVQLEVSAPNKEEWLPIGSLEPYSSRTTADILDSGPRWVVRFRTQGQSIDIAMTRPPQSGGNGSITVPSEAIDYFRSAGLRPSPCRRDDCP
jgi:hypothetical protein